MKCIFEFVPCCGSPRGEGEGIRAAAVAPPEDEEEERRGWAGRRRRRRRAGAAAAAEWKPSLCAISEDVVVVAVERVGGGERKKKKKAADLATGPERSASRKRSSGSYGKVHDRIFNGDEYDQRRPSFQAVIPAFSPAPFMF